MLPLGHVTTARSAHCPFAGSPTAHPCIKVIKVVLAGRAGRRALVGVTTLSRLFLSATRLLSAAPRGPGRVRARYLYGRPISDVVAELQAGTLSPDDIPISAFEHEGQLVTINNRGLAALSEAGFQPTNLSVISKELVAPNVIARLRQVPTALGESLPSPNIAVTQSIRDWTVLRTIAIPGG